MSAEGRTVGRGARHLIGRLVEQAGVRRAVWRVNRAARSAVRDAEQAVTRDALRRGETRTPKEVLAALEGDLVGRLSAGDRAAVEAFAARAARAEASITPRIERLAGGRLAGLEFRRKSLDSLLRKVATDRLDVPGRSAEAALTRVKDSVRYTMRLPQGDYARAARDAVSRMKDAGFEPVRLKNSWRNESGYMGINSVWRDPQTGHVFEMQFHTEASLAAKEGTHRIYDFQRLPGLDPQVGQSLSALQDRVFAQVPRPPNAPGVG